MKIEEYLLKKGIKPHLKGFDCIVESIKLIQKDREYKNNIVKRLYPKVGEILGETPSKVERAIRHAIKGQGLDNTNSEFLCLAVLELKGDEK